MSDPFTPTVSLLVKLGSIAVLVEEMREYNWDRQRDEWARDKQALEFVLNDSEVRDWLKTMDKMAMLPVKR